MKKQQLLNGILQVKFRKYMDMSKEALRNKEKQRRE
jgi:hypothetical protein